MSVPITPADPLLVAEVGPVRLDIVVADITTLAVDAIVNAANRMLAGGGGVDGAIHRAAGPQLGAACRELGGCETGEVKMTEGFALPARYVVHAVGPVWRGGGADEDNLLAACYRNALAVSRANNLTGLAFPAISTGIYGFPADRAARIAVGTVAAELSSQPGSLRRIIFCCFSPTSADHHIEAFGDLGLA